MFFKKFSTHPQDMPLISPTIEWTCASCWFFLSAPQKEIPTPQTKKSYEKAWEIIWKNPVKSLSDDCLPFIAQALKHQMENPLPNIPNEKQFESILLRLAQNKKFTQAVNETFPLWLKTHPKTSLLEKLPPKALKKVSQTSSQGLKAYQSQKTKSEGVESHSQIIEKLQNFHHKFFIKGYRNIDKEKIPSEFLIPQDITASPINPLLVKKTQRSFLEYPHLIAPALVLLPLSFLKELDLPYSVLLHSSILGDKGALSFLNPEMFTPTEQQKMMSLLVFQKTLLGFSEIEAPYYEALLEYGIENKIPVVGIKTLPSPASVYPKTPSSLLQQGFGMVLRASVGRTRPPLLTKAKPLLRRVEKHCGIDPYFKGLIKFFYERQNVKFPLEGPSALPLLPKNGFPPMPFLRDAYKKSLDEEVLVKEQNKLKRATNKAKSKKAQTLSRKM